MPSFFDSIKKIFDSRPKPGVPNAVREELRRTEEEIEARLIWENSTRFSRLKQKLEQDYLMQDLVEDDDLHLMIVDSEQSSGFIYYHDGQLASDKEVLHLMDHFKHQVKGMGYIQNLADRRLRQSGEVVEEIQRYYLKPKFQFDEEAQKVLHGFGNITIEVIVRNNETKYLKVLVNRYKDRNFHEAAPFGDFLKKILSTS